MPCASKPHADELGNYFDYKHCDVSWFDGMLWWSHYVRVHFLSSEKEKPALFDYDAFFGQQLQKKKDEHSYRVFKKVKRNAATFPFASEESQGKRDITVWCSNDYLGMSWHPKVKEAVRWGSMYISSHSFSISVFWGKLK